MLIRIRSTGDVLTDSAFLTLHNNVSFPRPLKQSDLDAFDADIVEDVTPPQAGEFQSVLEDGITQSEGVWVKKFKVVDWSQEQIDAFISNKKQNVKDKAIELLKQSDFSILLDVPLENKNDWVIYRKTLRDIVINPDINAVWPDKPNAVWSKL